MISRATAEQRVMKSEFCLWVGNRVSEHYGHDDGADLCYILMDQGVIPMPVSSLDESAINAAARIVAQHMEQP